MKSERRVLVTLDLDFADIRAYPPTEYFGIIVLRIRSASAGTVLPVVERLAGVLAEEPIEGLLWVVEEDRIRIRGR